MLSLLDYMAATQQPLTVFPCRTVGRPQQQDWLLMGYWTFTGVHFQYLYNSWKALGEAHLSSRASRSNTHLAQKNAQPQNARF